MVNMVESKSLLQNIVEHTLAKTESSSLSRVFISSLIDGEKGFVNFFLLPPFVQLGIADIFFSRAEVTNAF